MPLELCELWKFSLFYLYAIEIVCACKIYVRFRLFYYVCSVSLTLQISFISLFVVNFSYFGINYLIHTWNIFNRTHTHTNSFAYKMIRFVEWLSVLYARHSALSTQHSTLSTGLNSIEEKCFGRFICIRTNELQSHSFRRWSFLLIRISFAICYIVLYNYYEDNTCGWIIYHLGHSSRSLCEWIVLAVMFITMPFNEKERP